MPIPAPQLSPSVPDPDLLYLLCSDPDELAQAVSSWRAADIAESLNRLSAEAAAKVLANLPFDIAVEILDEPELERRHTVIHHMEHEAAVALIESIAADRRAALLRDLSPAKRTAILNKLDEPIRSSLKTLLTYPKGTAGSLMTTEFIVVSDNAKVHDAIQKTREAGRHRHVVSTVYVTQVGTGRLLRAVLMQDLLLADPEASIMELGDPRPPLVAHPRESNEDVARTIAKYNLLAIPVVDDDQRVLGVITVDDMIDSMVGEATRDAQQFGGVKALEAPYLRLTLPQMIQKRAPWLAVLFVGEMLTATAMGFFEHEIARAVVLSLFIPLIISSGGNSGAQATSLIIRAMAVRELRLRHWWAVAARELPTGLTLGLILGTLGFLRVEVWQQLGLYDYGEHATLLALTIGAALVGVVTFGSMAGSMLPFALRRLGFDPASASAPFVATLVDVTGIVIYFSVAFLLLHGTLL